MADASLAVTIEFARATETDDPFAFAEGKQDYVVRLEGASFRQVSLDWSPRLLGVLEQVRLPRRDPAVVAGLMDTDEYRGLDVDRTFVKYLRRTADPAGRTYWITSIRNGKALWRFRAQLFGSNEYFTKAGGENEGGGWAAHGRRGLDLLA